MANNSDLTPTSSRILGDKRPLNLLVCSGNLGNAEPDIKSLAAWIPDDGNCAEFLDHQKYPLISELKYPATATSADPSTCASDTSKATADKFDLIVLGMQESTFEPKNKEMLEEMKAQILAMEQAGVECEDGMDVDGGAQATTEVVEEDDEDSDEEMEIDGSSPSDGASRVVSRESRFIPSAAKKAASKVTKTSKKAAERVTKTSKKAAMTSARIATKTAKTATKTATAAAKTSVEQVSKTTKAARKGVSTIDTLTASRDHTKSKSTEMFLQDGTGVLHRLIQERLPSYTRLLSFQRGEMRLLVYSLNKHHSASIKSVRAQNTGMAGLANKGGIVAEVVVDKGTRLAFVACHLDAHEGNSKYEARVSSLADILRGTKKYAVPSIYPDASLANHYCFVLGDLNFRSRYKGQIKFEEQGEQVLELVEQQCWKDLNEADELRMALDNEECLFGFQTLYCNFPPTFKVERDEGFIYKKQRTPSYTDRILWKAGDKLDENIKALAYEPIDQFTTSDHKPIRGAFHIDLNQWVDLKHHAQQEHQGARHHPMRTMVFQWGPHRHHHEHDGSKFHILVSQVRCKIFPSEDRGASVSLSGSSVDSYVTLVSSPIELLLKKTSKWNQAKFAVKKFLSPTDPMCDAQSSSTTSDRWPRTRVMKDTYNPDWSDRELHCVLKTQQENGFPINLTGAILHIFVFKYNGRQTDEVVGSYPINLEHLIRQCACKECCGDDHSGDTRPSLRRSLRDSFRSLRQLNPLSRGLREAAGENMHSVKINGPLLKNGKQTGVLRCSVDAMWLSDAMAIAHGMGSMESEDPSEALEGSTGADGGQEGSSRRMSILWSRKSATRN